LQYQMVSISRRNFNFLAVGALGALALGNPVLAQEIRRVEQPDPLLYTAPADLYDLTSLPRAAEHALVMYALPPEQCRNCEHMFPVFRRLGRRVAGHDIGQAEICFAYVVTDGEENYARQGLAEPVISVPTIAHLERGIEVPGDRIVGFDIDRAHQLEELVERIEANYR